MTYPEHIPDPSNTDPQLRLDGYAQVKGAIAELLYTGPDSLAIGSFALGAGRAICVGSYISFQESRRRDTFESENTELIHRRPHNPMRAHADIIGMWDITAEAALYSLSAPFQLKEEAKLPFAPTMLTALAQSNKLYYLGYEPMESSMFEGTTMSHGLSHHSGRPHVALTEETVIEQQKYGSLDDADGLEVRLHGPAELAIPQEQYLVVQSSRVLRGPAEPTRFPIEIDKADAFLLRPSVAKDGSVRRGEAGELIVPLPYGQGSSSGTPNFKQNPQLSGTEALELLANTPPTLEDATDDFLGTLREQLLIALPLDIETSRHRIITMARQAVQKCLNPENVVKPRLIGSARVSEWLAKRIKEGTPREATDLDSYLEYMTARSV